MEELFNAKEARESAYKDNEDFIRESIQQIKLNIKDGSTLISGEINQLDVLESKLIELGFTIKEKYRTLDDEKTGSLDVKWV